MDTDHQSLATSLSNIAAHPPATTAEALDVRTEALETIRAIDANHALIRALPDGQDRSTWLADLVEAQSAPVADALAELVGQPFPVGAGTLVADLASAYLTEDRPITPGFEAPAETVQRVHAWLDRPLGDPADAELAADVTVAVLPYAERALGGPAAVPVVAAVVDLGLQGAKAAYQVATGKVSLGDGLDWIADRAAAGVGALVEHAVRKYAGDAGEWLGAAVGQYVGLAPLGRMAGRALGELAGPTVGSFLRKGVEALARATVRPVLSAVKSITERVKSFLFG